MGKEKKKYKMEFIFGITLLSVAFFPGFQTIQIGREWKESEPGIVITIKMVVLTEGLHDQCSGCWLKDRSYLFHILVLAALALIWLKKHFRTIYSKVLF